MINKIQYFKVWGLTDYTMDFKWLTQIQFLALNKFA